MPFNRQYMGWTGAATATTVVFPPGSTLRTTNTSGVDDPQSPVELMSAAPNPNEIWRIQAGDVVRVFLHDASAQLSAGQVFVGKRLLGGQGVRWYSVTQCNLIASTSNSQDINFAMRMQQSMRIHPGESLVLAVNDGGTAWVANTGGHEVQIPYEVAAGVSPAQMRASLARWG